MKKAEYKVPGGKLLAVEVSEKDGKIAELKLSGDFFMHPEPAIFELEKALLGKPVTELASVATSFFDNDEITLFGVEPLDFVKVIALALSPE